MKKIYVDPYIDRQTGVLKNKLGITNSEELSATEAEITSVAMRNLNQKPIQGDFNFAHLCKIHEKIFEDIYEWAGSPRIINIEKAERALAWMSVEYSHCDEIQREAAIILDKMKKVNWEELSLDSKATEFSKYMADLWKVHPFREGNTRTTVTFCCDFAESRGFGLDRKLFRDNSEYTRTALVAASAKFSNEFGDRSKPEYLIRIVKDAMERGERKRERIAKKEKAESHAQDLSSWENQMNQGASPANQDLEPQIEEERSTDQK